MSKALEKSRVYTRTYELVASSKVIVCNIGIRADVVKLLDLKPNWSA